MNDINFCRLHFLCGCRAGGIKRVHASGPGSGACAAGDLLADRAVRVKEQRFGLWWAPATGQQVRFLGETLEAAMPASISGIHLRRATLTNHTIARATAARFPRAHKVDISATLRYSKGIAPEPGNCLPEF